MELLDEIFGIILYGVFFFIRDVFRSMLSGERERPSDVQMLFPPIAREAEPPPVNDLDFTKRL